MMASEVAECEFETLQDEELGAKTNERQQLDIKASSEKLVSNGTTVHPTQDSRPIPVTSVSSPPLVMSMQLNVMWIVLLGLSFGTRLWQLTTPKYVVFDEVHFGKFTNYFMQNKFFFDVHPPLGKLLFAVTAYFSGYDGSFSFEEIGQELGDYEDYVWILRFVPAFLGSLIAPCIYEVILELGGSHWAAAFGAFLVVFENMLIVQSRFIFIDGALLFFSVFSVLSYLKFRNQANRAFGFSWWMWLILLGLSLTGACSTKYCGIMTLLVLGIIMCIDFWAMIGESAFSARDLACHFIARAFWLGVVPVALYLLQFYVLFAVLYKTGPHDDMLSSAFQASLEGGLAKITHGQAPEVAYGSQITLRHSFGRQCWLHSHATNYPIKYPDGRGSSHQQQVTCYSFKDVNNWWIIKDPAKDGLNVDYPPRPVIHGDVIQIVHGVSGRALNSHDVAAPLSPTHQEVSCYVDYNISMPAQNLWKVEVTNPDTTNKWRTIKSQVRIVHVNTTQALKITGLQLPDWGFRQFEVATDRVTNQQDTIWNVEEHQQNISYPEDYDPEDKKEETPTEPPAAIPLPFFYKFWEIQIKMVQSNKELSGEHTFSSTPSHWPVMKRGVAYWIHKTLNMQIYCIGNPVVWWVSTLAVLAYGAVLLVYLLRRRRAVFDIDQASWKNYCFTGQLLVIGYCLHYLPYFVMERTLFIHHYLPALLLKIVLLCVVAEHIYIHILRHRFLRYAMLAGGTALCVAVVVTFHFFSPFTYGHVALTSDQINRRRWLPLWDMLAHPNT